MKKQLLRGRIESTALRFVTPETRATARKPRENLRDTSSPAQMSNPARTQTTITFARWWFAPLVRRHTRGAPSRVEGRGYRIAARKAVAEGCRFSVSHSLGIQVEDTTTRATQRTTARVREAI